MTSNKLQEYLINIFLIVMCCSISITAQSSIQNPEIPSGESIVKLINAGKFAQAEKALDRMLAADSEDSKLLLARASVYSHQKKFRKAEYDFRGVLDREPNNINALVGLAYNYSWTGNYSKAIRFFNRALKINSNHADAKKGLAYSTLWKGDVDKSINRFEILAKETPNNSDVLVGLGQALLKAERKNEAKEVFSRAMEFDPGRTDAREGYEAATNEPSREQTGYKPRVDFTILGGYTRSELENIPGTTDEIGLRFIEIAVEPVPKTRFWFQYDNGLSLDSASLARTNERAPTYWVGGLVNYKRNYLTKFAYGRRNLPNDVNQNLFDVEQVFFLPRNYSLNVGAIFGPRSDDQTEFIFRSGVGVPVGERLRLEPTIFYAQSGLPGEKQFRGLLAGDYRFRNGIKIGGGFAAGKAFRPNPLSDDRVTDVFFRASAPVGKYFRPQVLIRREDIGGSNTTIFTFGVTISNKELK